MKILHTADLHRGQVIYQNYDRSDEHRHFFDQLERWCKEEEPDALLVSGDVFDIQQPSARVRKAFTDYFVRLHQECPRMQIVITAGNHDSASRIEADSAVWELANVHLVGMPPTDLPPTDPPPTPPIREGSRYIIKLECGYIVALPYMSGDRRSVIQSILDKVADENVTGLPVVLMAHQAVTGLDPAGHPFDIGTLRTLDPSAMGSGYDYLALGHIHKPQTILPIGQLDDLQFDNDNEDHSDNENYHSTTIHRAPVVRYSGSALHVSCDETYPHTVSLVEIDSHRGNVQIRQLHIDELRHFYVLPLDGTSFTSADDALSAISQFVSEHERGYIRLRFDARTDLPSNFSQMVYDALAPYNDEWRYNPKMLWTGDVNKDEDEGEKLVFEVAELQQMTDPMAFIERTQDQYPGLDIEDVRQAFEEVKAEMRLLNEEREMKNATSTS